MHKVQQVDNILHAMDRHTGHNVREKTTKIWYMPCSIWV